MQLYLEEVSRTSLSAQMDTATAHNLRLVAYEGGPGLVGIGALRNNQEITDLFISTNRNPRMAEVYTQLLDVWKELGGTDFVAFNSVKEPNNNGSWGVLENQDQDPATAPKYTALMDFIDANDRWWETAPAQSLNSLTTVDAAYAEASRSAADQLLNLVYEGGELALPVAHSGDLSSDLQADLDSQNGDQQVTVDELSDDRNEDFLYLEDSYEDRYALAGFIADPTDAELVGVLDSALEEYNPLVSLF